MFMYFTKIFSILPVFILYNVSNVLFAQNAPELLFGFPIIIDSINPGTAQPVVADINNDGTEEIIVSNSSEPFLVFVYQLNGTILEGWPQPYTEGDDMRAIAAGDIDGDGAIEIVARTFRRLYVWHSNGIVVDGFPQILAANDDYNFGKTILLYDLHKNNTLDIITTTFNQIIIHHSDGTVHSGWPKILNGTYATYPVAGDLDNNGISEIIVSSYSTPTPNTGWLYIFDTNGELLPNWPIMLDSGYFFSQSRSLCNINDDDSIEIIAPNTLPLSTNPPIYEAKITIYSPTARVVKQWYSPLPIGSLKSFCTVSLADFNNDGTKEFAVSDWENHIYIFDTSGNVLPGWPQQQPIAQRYTPILSDIDNDSIPELFLGDNGSLRDTGTIHCYNYLGQEMPWSPFQVFGNTGVRYPVFSDMDGDGTIEMVLLGNLGIRYWGNALSVYRFPNTIFSSTTSPWPQLQHDRYNTYQFGYVPSDNVVGVADGVPSVPEQFSLKQNYPNPFNPTTAIGFSLLAVGNVTLKIYDILGREVQTLLNNDRMQAGRHEIQFDGSALTSGVYFYRLSVDSKFSETKKLVLMK
ncbi:MAG: T9SS type A sorting domain-containing protein [Bacteroidota bacterium]